MGVSPGKKVVLDFIGDFGERAERKKIFRMSELFLIR